MGLKLFCHFEGEIFHSSFKSDLSGIEIQIKSICILSTVLFKSDLSGIETKSQMMDCHTTIVFKSDLSGIETDHDLTEREC